MTRGAEKASPPQERDGQESAAWLALIDGDEFDLARSVVSDLRAWRNYDDWRDFREASLLGLAMAGVDARFVPVRLSGFLKWCKESRQRPDQRSLDAYAEAIQKESRVDSG